MSIQEETTVEAIASLLRENREVTKQDIANEFENMKASVIRETVKHVIEHLDIRLDPVEQVVKSIGEVVATIPDEVELRITRTKDNCKRTRIQNEAEKEVPGIKEILSKGRLTWALSLQMFRGLSSDLVNSVALQNEQRDTNNCVTTLSSFLFAIQGQEKKSLHESVLGRGAGVIVRDVVFRLFWSARRGSLFKVSDESIADLRKVIPHWLAIHANLAVKEALQGHDGSDEIELEGRDGRDVYGKGTSAIAWMRKKLNTEQLRDVHVAELQFLEKDVSSCISEMESYRVMTGDGAKQQKRVSSADLASEDLHNMFRKAVSTARSSVLSHLNDARARGRDCVFQAFGFILEIMLGVNGISKSGFGIEIPDVSEREALAHQTVRSISQAIGESAIVSARASKAEKEKANDANKASLKRLIATFPSLSCTIKYKLRYNPDEERKSTEQDSGMDTSQEESLSAPSRSENTAASSTVEWDVCEVLSLHDVALDFLIEVVKPDSDKHILRICKESLRAVHALALAFRGLILQVLEMPVNDIEANMIGGVYVNEEFWMKTLRSTQGNGNAQEDSFPDANEMRRTGKRPRSSELRDRMEDNAGKRALMFLSEKRKTLSRVRKRLYASKSEYENHMVSVRRTREKRISESVIMSSRREKETMRDVDSDLDPV